MQTRAAATWVEACAPWLRPLLRGTLVLVAYDLQLTGKLLLENGDQGIRGAKVEVGDRLENVAGCDLLAGAGEGLVVRARVRGGWKGCRSTYAAAGGLARSTQGQGRTKVVNEEGRAAQQGVHDVLLHLDVVWDLESAVSDIAGEGGRRDEAGAKTRRVKKGRKRQLGGEHVS